MRDHLAAIRPTPTKSIVWKVVCVIPNIQLHSAEILNPTLAQNLRQRIHHTKHIRQPAGYRLRCQTPPVKSVCRTISVAQGFLGQANCHQAQHTSHRSLPTFSLCTLRTYFLEYFRIHLLQLFIEIGLAVAEKISLDIPAEGSAYW